MQISQESEAPHSIELEQVILGGLLVRNELIEHLSDAPAGYFFDPVHAQIFGAIKERLLDGRLASPVTLKAEAETWVGLDQLGGTSYLVKLAGAAMTASFEQLVADLSDLYARRTALEACASGIKRLRTFKKEDSPEAVLGAVETEVSTAVSAIARKKLTKSFLRAGTEAIGKINDAFKQGKAVGVSTGLKAVDQKIGAMSAGEMLILGGRPSMGKTAIALNMAVKAAQAGTGTFFASLEMFEDTLAQRALSQMLAQQGVRIAYSDMRRGQISEADFREVIRSMKEHDALPIEMCDPDCRSLSKLKSAVAAGERRLQARNTPMGLIVVDYLQLVNPVGLYRVGDTNGRVSAASESLKAMAVQYQCPILVLSQLNRAVEMRDPPMPQLSDLRDSGSIEQDADVIMFAYRQEYYTQKAIDAAGQDMNRRADLEASMAFQRNRLNLIIAKNRGGPTGRAELHCELPFNLVCDTSDVPAPVEELPI